VRKGLKPKSKRPPPKDAAPKDEQAAVGAEPDEVAIPVTLTFSSEWLASTGGSGAGDLDEICQRDAFGLPCLPMSSLKGVLRETAERFVEAKRAKWNVDLVESLFGRRAAIGDPDGTSEGQLVFAGKARLTAADHAAFRIDADAIGGLYGRRAQTAIDASTGAAAARTLRAVETAAPLVLESDVRLRAGDLPPDDCRRRLSEVAAFTLAIGKGKADGLGRVQIEVGKMRPAGRAAPSYETVDAAIAARRLVLMLEQTETATFSAASATEGAHSTRRCVPGSALLGWAARRYGDFGATAFDIFHSGQVRFGDARPLNAYGEALWPTPLALVEPKHRRPALANGALSAEVLVRRPATGERPSAQLDRIKGKLVSGSGRPGGVDTGLMLRTAMEDGRPAAGLLFGYESLLAEPHATKVWLAEIEADEEVDAGAWARLVAVFDGAELLLGRAAAGGQGGAFRSRVLPQASSFVPAAPTQPHAGRVVVWALSDLALIDEAGEPALTPTPQALGLGEGRLVERESAIAMRRWAPWRSHIRTRDCEIAAIEAGSVLVFEMDQPGLDPWRNRVGLHRDQGLGLIWIDPPLLAPLLRSPGGQPDSVACAPAPAPVAGLATPPPEPASGAEPQAAASNPRVVLARARLARGALAGEVLARFEADWAGPLRRLYASRPAGIGPSASQWGAAADAAAADMSGLRRALFGSVHPVCGAAGAASRQGDWGKRGFSADAEAASAQSFREWLEGALMEIGDITVARGLLREAARRAQAWEGRVAAPVAREAAA
jgi:CRISPR/Cas system CSM-associated protein Csm3 (group 7 of RAMP superfamily)